MIISGVPRSFEMILWPFLQKCLHYAQENKICLDFYMSFPKSIHADRFYNTDVLNSKDLIFNSHVKVLFYEDIFQENHKTLTLREKNTYIQWKRIESLFLHILPTYKYIVRCRPDIEINCNPKEFIDCILQSNNENTIYIPNGFNIFDHKISSEEKGCLNDQIAWGSYEVMKQYCSLSTYLQTYTKFPLISEQALSSMIKEKNLQIQRVNLLYRLRISQCVSIAICGESGAGKSTLSKLIQDILPFDQTLLLETDRYHKWERGAKEYQTYTHYHPEANHLEKLAEDAYSLHLGDDIFTVDYDHDTGKFTEPQQIESASYMILCGLHTLYKDALREIFDLKIYLDTEESLTHTWKVERDMRERGASRESILKAIEKRREDFQTYIAPQKKYADIIIQFCKVSGELQLHIGIQNTILLPLVEHVLQTYTTPILKEDGIPWFACIHPPEQVALQAHAKVLGYSGQNTITEGFNGLLQLLSIAVLWKPLTNTFDSAA